MWALRGVPMLRPPGQNALTMAAAHRPRALPWLDPGDPFPPVSDAWGDHDPAPGLVAAGGDLSVATLLQAYRQGVFPWFSEGQPPLWWSPDPRMVLPPTAFRLHHNLRKTIRSAWRAGRLEVRIDHAFERVIGACALTPRPGQNGTWIVPDMVAAYTALHRAGHAHSVETWWDGELAGGLYCINTGAMVFGESMFSHRSNASKIALAALVCCASRWGVPLIDCQQETAHLASMGAAPVPRAVFVQTVAAAVRCPTPDWRFDPVYWTTWLQHGGHNPT